MSTTGNLSVSSHPYDYVLKDFNLENLSEVLIFKHLRQQIDTSQKDFYQLFPEQIDINYAAFTLSSSEDFFPLVQIVQDQRDVTLTCRCSTPKNKLCAHQAQVLYNLLRRTELQLYFNETVRKQKLYSIASNYGLGQEPDLEKYFNLHYQDGQVLIKARDASLQPFDAESQKQLENLLIAEPQPVKHPPLETEGLIMVLGQHRYYSHLTVNLYQAEKTRRGKIKNPLKEIQPTDLAFRAQQAAEIKFFSGIAAFQQQQHDDLTEQDLMALKVIVQNPLQLPFYLQAAKSSGTLQAAGISPVTVALLETDLRLSVHQKDDFYEITGRLVVKGKSYHLDQLAIIHQCFIQLHDQLYLIGRSDLLKVIGFFRKQSNRLIIHQSKYPEFQKSILIKLEGHIQVDYSYLKPANKSQLEEKGFDLENEQLLYLSESEDFILLTPVMRYGHQEIPVLSKKQIQAQDKLGNIFTVFRDKDAELKFIGHIIRQHPYFYEQDPQDSFYLHRKRFMEADWFLEAFESWRSRGIHILGFNQLKGHKWNGYQAKINIEVLSGTDWFETKVDVKFGKQRVALKHLHKSIRNKSRFVTLDDGTQGILPQEWIEKFATYFQAGEVGEESIRIPKIRFATIQDLYENSLLSGDVKNELHRYRQQLEGADQIKPVPVPDGLMATLRPYQQEGLNWLNAMDDLNFGACLADDMGLGKTVQILAFILLQRQKRAHQTNLVVVPASLIFNWKAEIKKFAPTIRLKVFYGPERIKRTTDFDQYEIILTAYGTLLSDIHLLKSYRFNYVILDESQLIKNPESQRYKAARMLQARNRIVMTGTPLENHTLDLYGQLSFACPGLFGSKQQFSDLYSTPIDQFKDRKRAEELQQKIRPFILRRTKAQVSPELPDKTEILLYCEMGEEQREVYEANKKEIQDFILKQNDDELPKTSMHVLKSITQLRQICNSAALLADGKSYLQASSKITVLLEQVEARMGRHKILIFSQFVTMLDLIKKELDDRHIAYAYLTGQTKNREEVVRSFQDRPELSVFLISLKAGGTGLNLTKADYVYLVDPWWNPAVENQAIDRAYRIGQHKNVMAVRLICPDTIEEKMMKLQATKRDLVDNLIQSDGNAFRSWSKAELLNLLS